MEICPSASSPEEFADFIAPHNNYSIEFLREITGSPCVDLINRQYAVVSLPLKYMHSPVETLDLTDLEATASLLAAFVQDLSAEGGTFLAD